MNLCMTEEDSISEIGETPHSEAHAFEDLRLVVAAFNKSI